uniref:Uncharacterized protein n=1 Tax=Prosopanche americana TaxID=29816 RepID=A0A6H0DRD0_PROAM|nr:hypothetical protein RF2 [Prosopanche americana]
MINIRNSYNNLHFRQNFKKSRLSYKSDSMVYNITKNKTMYSQKPFDFSKFSFLFYIESNELINKIKKYFILRIKKFLLVIFNNIIKFFILSVFIYSFFNYVNNNFFVTFTISDFNSVIPLNEINEKKNILRQKKYSFKYNIFFSKKNISKINLINFYDKNVDIIGINMYLNKITEDFIFFFNFNNKLKKKNFSFYEYKNNVKNIYFNFYFIDEFIDEEKNFNKFNNKINHKNIKYFKYKENKNIFFYLIKIKKFLIKKKYYNKFFNKNIFCNFIIIFYLIKNTYIFNIRKDVNKYLFKNLKNKYNEVKTEISRINLKNKYNEVKTEISRINLKNKYNEVKTEISRINLSKTVILIKYKINFSINVLSNNIYLFKVFNYLFNIALKRQLIFNLLRLHVFKIYLISNINSSVNKFIINILKLTVLLLYNIYTNIINLIIYINIKYTKNILKLNLKKILNYKELNYQKIEYNIILKDENIIPYLKYFKKNSNSLISLFLKTNSIFNINKDIKICNKKFPYKVSIKNKHKYNKLLYFYNNIFFTQNINLNRFLKKEILKILQKKIYYNPLKLNFVQKDIFFKLYFNNFSIKEKETCLLNKTLDSDTLFKTYNTNSNKINNIDFNLNFLDFEEVNKKKIYKKYFKIKLNKIFIITKKYFKYIFFKVYMYLYYNLNNFINLTSCIYYLKKNFSELNYFKVINIINIEKYYKFIIHLNIHFKNKFTLKIKKYLKYKLKTLIKIFFFKNNVDQIDYFLNELNLINFIKIIILISKVNTNNFIKLVNTLPKNKLYLKPIKKNIIKSVIYVQLNFIQYNLLLQLFFIYILIFFILKYFNLTLKYIKLLKFEYEINLILMTKRYSINLYVILCKYGYLKACIKHTVSLYNNIFFTLQNEVFSVINKIQKYIIRFLFVDILFNLLEIDTEQTPYYYSKVNLNLKNIYINLKIKYKEYLHFYTESKIKNWYKFFIFDFYFLRNSISQELFQSLSHEITEEFYKRIIKDKDEEDNTIIKNIIYTKKIMSKQNETQFDFESWINTNDINFAEERHFLIQFINIFLNINKEKKLSNYFFKNISIKNYENENFVEYGYLYLKYFLDMLKINSKEANNKIIIKKENRVFIANYQKISEYLFLTKNIYKIRKKPYSFSLTMIPSSSKGILLVGQSEEMFVLKEKIIKDYADLPFIILNPIHKELSDFEIAKYSYDESDLLFVDKFDISNSNTSTKQTKKIFKKIYNTDKGMFEFENIKLLNNLMPKRKTSIYDVFNIVTQFNLLESISSCIIFIPNIHLCHYSLKFKQFYELNKLISKFNKNNIILAYTNKPKEVDPILIGYDKLSKCILLKKPTIEVKKKYIFNLLKTKGFFIEKKELLNEHLNIQNIRDLYILTNQTLSLSLTQNKYVINSKIINKFIFYFFRFNQFIKTGHKVPIGIVFYQIGRFFIQNLLNSLIIDPMSVYLIDFKTKKYPLYKNYYELGTNIKKLTLIIYLLICSSGLIAYKFFNNSEIKNITHEYFNNDLNLIINLLNLEKFFYFDYFRLIKFIDNIMKNEKEILNINKYNLIKSNILELDFSFRNAYNYETDILPTTNPSNKKFNLLLNILLEHFLTNKKQYSLLLKIYLEKTRTKKDIYIPYEKFMYVMYEDYRFSDQLKVFIYNILKPLLDKNFIFNFNNKYKYNYYNNYSKCNNKNKILLKMQYEAIDYLKKIFYNNRIFINKLFKNLIIDEFICPDKFKELFFN